MSRPRTPYGTVSSRFWDDDVGHHLQRAGAGAVIVALYLGTNRHANALGLYRLPLAAVRRELPVLTEREIGSAFATLAELDIAYYDVENQVVWVVDMASQRLYPENPRQPAAANDARVVGLIREYEEVPANRFLGAFYDHSARHLGLAYRRPGTVEATGSSVRIPTRRPPVKGSYGVLLSTFWDGDLGYQLQRIGPAPLILTVYLHANFHANLIGLYVMPLDDLIQELPVIAAGEIPEALASLERLGAAAYDHAASVIWVRHMVGLRLFPLSPGRRFGAKDEKRRKGVERAYDDLPANRFLGAFYDLEGERLQIPRRRPGTGELGAPKMEGVSEGVWGSVSPGVSGAVSGSEIRRSGDQTTKEAHHHGDQANRRVENAEVAEDVRFAGRAGAQEAAEMSQRREQRFPFGPESVIRGTKREGNPAGQPRVVAHDERRARASTSLK